MNTHIEAPRHSMSGNLNPKRVSPGVNLYGHYTIHFTDEFSGTITLERSSDNVTWTTVKTFGAEPIVTMVHKAYEGSGSCFFRLNGEQLRSLAGYKIFDHAEP